MNKNELIAAIATKANLTKKDAEVFVKAALEVVKEAVAKEDKVQLIGFGTFEVKERAARKGKNPKTHEVIDIPACKVPVFHAGKAFKDVIPQPVKPVPVAPAKVEEPKAAVAEKKPARQKKASTKKA